MKILASSLQLAACSKRKINGLAGSCQLPAASKGFTLIELLISISLIVIISSAVYFAVTSALESWNYCKDQLSLQKVLTETMDNVISGTSKSWGLKDSLEIVSAENKRMEFIPPWADDTHSVANREFIYTLNRRLKSGAPVPIGEVKMPDQDSWRLVPVNVVPLEESEVTQVKLGLSVPEGSDLRFVYHPDWNKEPDVAKKIFWDAKNKELMLDTGDHVESISKNFFGVEITDVNFKYFTSNNEPAGSLGGVSAEELQIITGVEVEIQASREDQTQKISRFVNLRNAPMRTGYLTLKRGMKIPIPDSKNVKTLVITNLSGISNNDVLQLEALPRAGQAWRLTIEFERIGSGKPLIRKMDVEYPTQRSVYTDYPKMNAELGVNLMLIGQDGLFDYDDDEDVDDIVNLEGDVVLYVNEMSIDGAGLFVRP